MFAILRVLEFIVPPPLLPWGGGGTDYLPFGSQGFRL